MFSRLLHTSSSTYDNFSRSSSKSSTPSRASHYRHESSHGSYYRHIRTQSSETRRVHCTDRQSHSLGSSRTVHGSSTVERDHSERSQDYRATIVPVQTRSFHGSSYRHIRAFSETGQVDHADQEAHSHVASLTAYTSSTVRRSREVSSRQFKVTVVPVQPNDSHCRSGNSTGITLPRPLTPILVSPHQRSSRFEYCRPGRKKALCVRKLRLIDSYKGYSVNFYFPDRYQLFWAQ